MALRLQSCAIWGALGAVPLSSDGRPIAGMTAGSPAKSHQRRAALFTGFTGLWAIVRLRKAAGTFTLMQSRPLDGFVRIETVGDADNQHDCDRGDAGALGVGRPPEGLLRQLCDRGDTSALGHGGGMPDPPVGSALDDVDRDLAARLAGLEPPHRLGRLVQSEDLVHPGPHLTRFE